MRRRTNFVHLLTFLVAAVAAAQSFESPKFDVASVRLHDFQSTAIEPLRCSNGRFIALGIPFRLILGWAYDLDMNQARDTYQQLPKVSQAANLSYDIQAKSEHPLTESQCKVALQAVLADRFKLTAHWESRKAQVYDLTVARGGPKMQKASDADTKRGISITLDGTPVTGAPGGAVVTGWTMPELAQFLSVLALRVTDKTGLEGKYKIVLKCSTRPPRADQVADDPDLETALQQQLGLKLEAHQGTVRTFLVDHIEPPSAN